MKLLVLTLLPLVWAGRRGPSDQGPPRLRRMDIDQGRFDKVSTFTPLTKFLEYVEYEDNASAEEMFDKVMMSEKGKD